MELAGIEMSRIVYLTQVNRPDGQIYMPEAAAKLVQRYSFAKYPSVDELTRDSIAFGIGRFGDVQINELQVYNDGIIVASRADTAILDEFIADLFGWTEKEFGMTQAITAKPEKHFESAIVVKSKTDIALALNPQNDVAKIFNRIFLGDVVPFQLTGFLLECEQVRVRSLRKPIRFSLERRVGFSFSENVFYSIAPLTTKDHLKFLSDLESLPAHSA